MDRLPEPDPTLCEREPIHIPGAIQPHGALLAAVADRRLVSHASANLAAFLGRPAEAVLGQPLEEALGEAACRVLCADPPDGTALGAVFSLPGPQGGTLHLRSYQSERRICVDIEPARWDPGQRPPTSLALSVRNVSTTMRQSWA
jgi:light-regulated signal transduction histidine kinase (bacteriophytochrome)